MKTYRLTVNDVIFWPVYPQRRKIDSSVSMNGSLSLREMCTYILCLKLDKSVFCLCGHGAHYVCAKPRTHESLQ